METTNKRPYLAPQAEMIVLHTEDVIFESGDNDVSFGA